MRIRVKDLHDAAAQLGARGGRARAKTLSLDELKAISRLGNEARQAKKPAPDGLPKATHMGEIKLGDALIPCAVLADGTRVLSQRGVGGALGRKRGGRDWLPQLSEQSGGGKLPFFMAAANIKPFLSAELVVAGSNPIFYLQGSAGVALGLRATALPDLCEAWLRAREAGALRADQLHIAMQAEIIVRGLAHLGIDALVDEATGFQKDRPDNALSKILEAFIARELRPWVKTFPEEFYREMFRLRGWRYSPTSPARSQLVGMLTNDLVYKRLAPGVLKQLQRTTPRNASGRLKTHFHRKLSEDIGHPKLREHLNMLIVLMRGHLEWKAFVRQLNRSLPRFGQNYELGLGDNV